MSTGTASAHSNIPKHSENIFGMQQDLSACMERSGKKRMHSSWDGAASALRRQARVAGRQLAGSTFYLCS